jgi:hypothetical protein
MASLRTTSKRERLYTIQEQGYVYLQRQNYLVDPSPEPPIAVRIAKRDDPRSQSARKKVAKVAPKSPLAKEKVSPKGHMAKAKAAKVAKPPKIWTRLPILRIALAALTGLPVRCFESESREDVLSRFVFFLFFLFFLLVDELNIILLPFK